MSKRSKEDELYLRLIGNPTLYENISEDSKTINLYIFDLRPYINAVGNQIKGKGYENTADYKNAVLEFQNIENCHFVRDSFKKIEILYTQNIE